MTDYSKMNGNELCCLLMRYPNTKTVDWSKLDGDKHERYGVVLCGDECDTYLISREQCIDMLNEDPANIQVCVGALGELNGADWCKLIDSHIDLSTHCYWHTLTGGHWVWLLKRYPQFSKHADWSKLSGDNWEVLLTAHPNLKKHCDWNTLTELNWWWLLVNQPSLFKKEKMQIMAVGGSRDAIRLITHPSDRVKRLHALKWKI